MITIPNFFRVVKYNKWTIFCFYIFKENFDPNPLLIMCFLDQKRLAFLQKLREIFFTNFWKTFSPGCQRCRWTRKACGKTIESCQPSCEPLTSRLPYQRKNGLSRGLSIDLVDPKRNLRRAEASGVKVYDNRDSTFEKFLVKLPNEIFKSIVSQISLFFKN